MMLMDRKSKEKLVKYVDELVKKGYDVKVIEQSLQKRGFPKEVVRYSVSRASKGYNPDRFNWHQQVFLFFYFIGLLLFIIWLSFMTLAPMSAIFAGLAPTLVTLLFVYLLFNLSKKTYKFMVWALPIIFCAAFYLLSNTKTVPLLNNLDTANVTVLNFILSFAAIIVLDVFENIEKTVRSAVSREKVVEKVITRLAPVPEPKIIIQATPKKVEEFIQSIEDKSKALNSSIGRVYSVRRRGNESMREKIKIKSEWYNEFSSMDQSDDTKLKLEKAHELVSKIKAQLDLMKKTEAEVFGEAQAKRLVKLKRDSEGKDRIIDVLIANDKDPIETYYNAALEFCEKAFEAIKHVR